MNFLRHKNKFNIAGVLGTAPSPTLSSAPSKELIGPRIHIRLQPLPQGHHPASPTDTHFAHSLNTIVTRRRLNTEGVHSSCREICNTLSRYPYLYNAIGNQDDIVINTSSSGCMTVGDGGALEAYLQYGNVPYTAIYGERIERFEISGSNAPMLQFELPRDFDRKSWIDHFNTPIVA